MEISQVRGEMSWLDGALARRDAFDEPEHASADHEQPEDRKDPHQAPLRPCVTFDPLRVAQPSPADTESAQGQPRAGKLTQVLLVMSEPPRANRPKRAPCDCGDAEHVMVMLKPSTTGHHAKSECEPSDHVPGAGCLRFEPRHSHGCYGAWGESGRYADPLLANSRLNPTAVRSANSRRVSSKSRYAE